MRIIGDDKLGIGCHSTIHKFIVVRILFYKTKVEVGFLKNGGMQTCNGLHHIMRYAFRCLRCQNLLVLVQNLSINAKAYFPSQRINPYLMIRAACWQRLQKAIGIKNDSTHNDTEYACALVPTGRWFARQLRRCPIGHQWPAAPSAQKNGPTNPSAHSVRPQNLCYSGH